MLSLYRDKVPAEMWELFLWEYIMPTKPLKPCGFPGCPNLTTGKFCDKHKTPERASANSRGYGKAWQKARENFLRHHPVCAMCGSVATVVDHIIPHRGNKELFWDHKNWQPLCKACHDKKTGLHDSTPVYSY